MKELEKTLVLKFWLKRCHLILALISGIFLINISLSGALLLFAKDIQTMINPQYWLINHGSESTATVEVLPLSALITEIENKTGEKINFIELPEHSSGVWQVKLMNEKIVNIDPYTAEILLTHRFYDTFYGFVMAWHRWLLYRNSQGEMPMQQVIATSSLFFMLQLIIGFLLWMKPKHRLKRFKINHRANIKIKLYQLHGSIGIICAVPLLLIAFSGITFYWSEQTKNIVQWLTGSKVQQHNFQPPQLDIQKKSKNNFDPSVNVKGIDKAYSTVPLSLPNGKVFRIYLPKKSNDVLVFRVKTLSESHAYSWVWADPHTGEVLDSFNASNQSLATQVWNFRYKFHIGEFVALPIKFIWLFLSILPAFFVSSGIYFWLKRKKPLINDKNINIVN